MGWRGIERGWRRLSDLSLQAPDAPTKFQRRRASVFPDALSLKVMANI